MWEQTLMRTVLLQANLSCLSHLFGKSSCSLWHHSCQPVTFRSNSVTRKTGHQGGSVFLWKCRGTTVFAHSLRSLSYQCGLCVWCIYVCVLLSQMLCYTFWVMMVSDFSQWPYHHSVCHLIILWTGTDLDQTSSNRWWSIYFSKVSKVTLLPVLLVHQHQLVAGRTDQTHPQLKLSHVSSCEWVLFF